MTKWIAVSAVGAIVLAVSVAGLDAGPEKIAFPANWREHVLYATLYRYDTKQYRELYGTPDAVRAATAPDGNVPASFASEMTKSCFSCGLWHWKHAV